MFDWLRNWLGESRTVIDLRLESARLAMLAQQQHADLLHLRDQLEDERSARMNEMKMASNWALGSVSARPLWGDVPGPVEEPMPEDLEPIYRESGRGKSSKSRLADIDQSLKNGFSLGDNHPIALFHAAQEAAAKVAADIKENSKIPTREAVKQKLADMSVSGDNGAAL